MSRFLHLPVAGHPTIRLIGFPHAGGATTAYFALSQRFPPDWDVMFLEYAGRGRRHRERLATSFDAVVEDALQAVDPWTDAPFALFGHGFGAAVARAVALRLLERGCRPRWVGSSGLTPGRSPVLDRLAGMDDEFMVDWMIDAGGIPEMVRTTPEFVALTARVLRADLQCLDGSGELPPLPVPLGVFGGDADPLAPAADLARWAAHCAAGCTVTTFPGGHFYLFGDQLPALVAAVTAAVRSAPWSRPGAVP
ncbi:thioesterase II family protein [Nocardia sp. CA-151230]|uniref:thioesterase II family protein n=1 Tax=Nocardia sp. CA-151230 TaxID=3239982 RepID=UPI003D8DD918